MTETVIPVHLSGSLLEDVSQDADRRGMSLESWFVSLAEDRMRDKQVTERFFLRRQRAGDAEELLAILDKAPDGPPMPGDELEP